MDMIVCVDPGHGGADPGAKGTRSFEKDVVLSVGNRLAKELQKHDGVKVAMTREIDRFVPLNDRSRMANEMKADCFISIHCNGSTNPHAFGWEIFTSPGQTQGDVLATTIHAFWMHMFPNTRVRADYSDGDVDKEANFSVLRRTSMPAVLVELGFISNPHDEAFLLDVNNQRFMAQAIAEGVVTWKK
jgi:N-acetylmuramoyl-L-alanine amidase